MLHQAVYNSALDFAFTFSLHRASKSARGESLEPSQVFHGHAQSPMTVHDPPGYVGPFHSPVWTSHSPVFPLIFLISLLLVPTIKATSNSFSVKQLLLIVLNKCPGGRTVFTEVGLSQMK